MDLICTSDCWEYSTFASDGLIFAFNVLALSFNLASEAFKEVCKSQKRFQIKSKKALFGYSCSFLFVSLDAMGH